MSKGDAVFARVCMSGLVLALAVPVSAQQMTPPDPNQEAIKYQVMNFELLLRNAVLRAGKEVADKTHEIVPGVQLEYMSDVGVSSWWTPDFGYTFDVTVPSILPSLAGLVTMLQQPNLARPVAGTANASSRTGAMSTPKADPMVVSPVKAFNPTKEYSDRARQALIDALVDNSGGLQLKPGERLQLIAGPEPVQVPNRMGDDSRKLILTVKGDDLLLFRQGKLTRDELIKLIRESRF